MCKQHRQRPGGTHLLVHKATNAPYVFKGEALWKDGERGCCQLQGRRGSREGAANPRQAEPFSLTSVGCCLWH